ncbi:MAG: glutaredoxin family protein [Betaproteobacteria bacterium]|nr:MAG: glutaredoxin family protein [Betaproteobacteria bacterium]
MKITYTLILLPFVLVGIVGAAEMYRWVDANGKVHYTDTLPPLTAKSVQKKVLGNQAGEAQMPYSLQQAMKNFPVTFYNSKCGEPCINAIELLTNRGIPFSKKNPGNNPADAEALKKVVGGELVVPVLVVGNDILKGFEKGSWNSALDLAGYPKSSLLPKSFIRTAPTAD